jgi:hypothetical protein
MAQDVSGRGVYHEKKSDKQLLVGRLLEISKGS